MSALTIKDLTRSELERLYLKELLTETQIAKLYNTSQVTINSRRRKWGIATLGKTGRMELALPALTVRQNEILIGSLLGDGGLQKISSNTARFKESHSLAQEAYCRWKELELAPYANNSHYLETVRGTKTYSEYVFTTHTCTMMYPYFEMFYPAPRHKKVFPPNLKDVITPLALAVWYLDDGNLSGKYQPQITFGLCEESLLNSIEALKSLGLLPEIYNNPNGTKTIYFPKDNSEKFFQIITPHVPECMEYKLPVDTRRKEILRNAKDLTHQEAQDLFGYGYTVKEIAVKYDVGESTVRRRLEPETNDQRKRLSYTPIAAEIALSNLEIPDWNSMEEAAQSSWVDTVYDIIKLTDFPYPASMDKYHAHIEFQKLENITVEVEEGIVIPRTYYGLKLADGYFPNRYQARYKNSKSSEEAWNDGNMMKRAIRLQLKSGDPVTPHRLKKAIQFMVKTPTNFRCGVAKAVYQRYADIGDVVYDPCIGYGGRLLGALAANVRYIGTDVDIDSYNGSKRLSEVLERTHDVDLYLAATETFEVPCKVKLVFTSPPYFDREQYTGHEDQAHIKHGSSYEEWLAGFMRPLIQNAYEALEDEGHLALNVTDLKEGNIVLPLEADVTRLATLAGFVYKETLRMPLANLSKKKFEPILVFQKTKEIL